jgi:hypothetical protein
MDGTRSTQGEMAYIHTYIHTCISVTKPERDHFEDLCRLEDNIKMDLKEKGYKDVVCIRLAQDRARLWDLVKTVMNLRIP